MSRAAEPVRAVGRLGPDGSWVGFAPTPDGYRLVFGAADGSVRVDRTDRPSRRRAGLVAVAIAFVLSSLPDPPAELEATQADLARLVRSLVVEPPDPADATRARRRWTPSTTDSRQTRSRLADGRMLRTADTQIADAERSLHGRRSLDRAR